MKPLIQRLLPAPRHGGFRMADQWVWCGSVIRAQDGRYHMFASIWDKNIPFVPHWLTNSRIVRAVADTPIGPYQYCDEVLPPRVPAMWDGRMTHNPTIHHDGKQYLLFYTGTTYDGSTPSPQHIITHQHPQAQQARANQRIGVAVSKQIQGPWIRLDQPILEPRPGHWDAYMTANPAVVIEQDNSILLYYKSALDEHGKLMYGLAKTDRWDACYQRVTDKPLFDFKNTEAHIEDAYVWKEDGAYHMIFKDMTDQLTGEFHAGVQATSQDGIHWNLSQPPKAYSRNVQWDNGSHTLQGALERPQMLLENGKSTHLFFATADGPGKVRNAHQTWTMVVPLAQRLNQTK